MFNMDQFILRFNARLVSENREDNSRQFIVNFFCGDDTLCTYLETDKNSGINRGKYLERMRHWNKDTNDYYREKDMQIGDIIN